MSPALPSSSHRSGLVASAQCFCAAEKSTTARHFAKHTRSCGHSLVRACEFPNASCHVLFLACRDHSHGHHRPRPPAGPPAWPHELAALPEAPGRTFKVQSESPGMQTKQLVTMYRCQEGLLEHRRPKPGPEGQRRAPGPGSVDKDTRWREVPRPGVRAQRSAPAAGALSSSTGGSTGGF